MRVILGSILLLSILIGIESHSYLTKPVPRRRFGQCRIGGPPEYPINCPGPCGEPYAANQIHTDVQRGQTFRVEWPRNNHPGGFIRLSFIDANTAETHANFDGNAYRYSCFESNCQADAGAGQDSGDSRGAEGVNPCWTDITIPTHLTDGRWTMQWSWYGGTQGYTGDYYSCANMRVSGGAAVTAQQNPIFVGGDVSNPGNNNVCEYWSTDRLHYCVTEPCSDTCNPATSPVGKCGWPAIDGAPFIERLANPPPPPPSPTPPPPADVTTGKPYVAPTVITTSIVNDGVLDISVQVTVKLVGPPTTLDLTTFSYEIISVLGIPTSGLSEVLISLDESTTEYTIVGFKLKNARDINGVRMDPIAAANLLRTLATTADPKLDNTATLKGMSIVDETLDDPNTPFHKSVAFIIIIAIGGAVLITVAVVVGIVLVKRRNHH